ncbi:PREDICTED: uncharacterized protein PF11_0213 [Habropoda laboriosa]|uniref:uncharacterized protein PF11_0213 n=1 Tax=Habropoda laboriosa TaxID=597456 RepID=UPI00083D0760|nr:PREDICTED: uncharacterized protein PF11_0213 [Habropoda laboriosa]
MTSMEDDIDIYEDLRSFETTHNENFISNNEEKIVGEQVQLKKHIAELMVKLENSQKVNKNLEINLFSLLKTAKAEIARKDKMIDELKKNLDDVTFKRSIHSKPSNYIAHKSAFCETSINMHHKLPDVCLFPNETGLDVSLVESTYSRTNKEQQSKSTLMPVTTVFGERLLKRMVDEQNLEKKDKQLSKSNGSNNAVSENIEGYVIESDKENGSLGDTNICNTKEIQSSAIAQYKGNEHLKKNLATVPKITSKDLHMNNKNNNKSEINGRFDRRSTLIGNYSGKRTSEDANRHIPVKRKKSNADECFSESLKRETEGSTVLEAKEKYTFPPSRCANVESSGNFRWYSRSSSMEVKKHSYFTDNTNKKEERKDSKDKNVSDASIATCEKREATARSSKRHNKSTENSTLEERNGGYRGCVDTVLKRDDYRVNHSERHRGGKQREYHYTEDYRSRVKSASYAKCRGEKYSRNQYNKHTTTTTTTTATSYEERFEKRYNFRRARVPSDKLKHLSKRDFSNDHGTSKHSAIDRISMDQKAGDVKRDDHFNEYDSSERRLKKGVDKTIKREKKQTVEYNKHSHRKFSAEKLSEHSKQTSVSGRSVKKDDFVIEQINNVTPETEHELGVDEELRKYAEEELLDSWTELEDGEISSTSNSVTRANEKRREGSKDQRCELPLEELVDNNNAASVTSLKCDTTKIETVEYGSEVPINTNLSNTDDVVSFAMERKSSENMENVENVENIEKFIRDYTSKNDKVSKMISVTSETIPVSHDTLANAGVTIQNDTSALNEDSSNCVEAPAECCAVLTSNGINIKIVSFDENPKTNKKPLTKIGNPGNFLSYHDDNDADVGADRLAVQEDEQAERTISLKHGIDDRRSSNDNPTTELYMATDQSKSENIVKEYHVPRNMCDLPSTILLESSIKTDKRNNNDNNVDIATNDDTGNNRDNNTCNDRTKGIINENRNSEDDRLTTPMTVTKSEYKNTIVRMETIREKEMRKLVVERGETRLQEIEVSQSRNQNKNTAKNISINVHGKIVLYARRRKPVCLANNNANMTVLINNKSDAKVHASSTKDATMV